MHLSIPVQVAQDVLTGTRKRMCYDQFKSHKFGVCGDCMALCSRYLAFVT